MDLGKEDTKRDGSISVRDRVRAAKEDQRKLKMYHQLGMTCAVAICMPKL
jgi:hypothetical protein